MKKFVTTLKIAATAVVVLASQSLFAADEINVTENDVAISGYDAVAYFTDSEPTKGKAKFTATHEGAIYQFASKGNRDLFKADPEKYAPQYGGFCAFGVTKNRKFAADPEAWRVVDGKLYLNLNKNVQKIWLEDVPGNIEQAEEIWPEIQGSTDAYLEQVGS